MLTMILEHIKSSPSLSEFELLCQNFNNIVKGPNKNSFELVSLEFLVSILTLPVGQYPEQPRKQLVYPLFGNLTDLVLVSANHLLTPVFKVIVSALRIAEDKPGMVRLESILLANILCELPVVQDLDAVTILCDEIQHIFKDCSDQN